MLPGRLSHKTFTFNKSDTGSGEVPSNAVDN